MAKSQGGHTKWKKGVSGNPKGRTPVLLPELQFELDKNKNKVKELILQYFNFTETQVKEKQTDPSIPYIEKILASCFKRTDMEGDVVRFRMLLEIVFGKIPEEKNPFEVSPEEKLMVMTFRKRLEEQNAGIVAPSQESDQRRLGSDPKPE